MCWTDRIHSNPASGQRNLVRQLKPRTLPRGREEKAEERNRIPSADLADKPLHARRGVGEEVFPAQMKRWKRSRVTPASEFDMKKSEAKKTTKPKERK